MCILSMCKQSFPRHCNKRDESNTLTYFSLSTLHLFVSCAWSSPPSLSPRPLYRRRWYPLLFLASLTSLFLETALLAISNSISKYHTKHRLFGKSIFPFDGNIICISSISIACLPIAMKFNLAAVPFLPHNFCILDCHDSVVVLFYSCFSVYRALNRHDSPLIWFVSGLYYDMDHYKASAHQQSLIRALVFRKTVLLFIIVVVLLLFLKFATYYMYVLCKHHLVRWHFIE